MDYGGKRNGYIVIVLPPSDTSLRVFFFLQLFPGNNYMFETTTVYFERSVIARYVRVMPQTWHRKICLRFEVLGCYKEQRK